MDSGQRIKIAKVISSVVIISGALVMVGWIFNIGILKNISPTWISMKFDTALAFVFSGITLYCIVRAQEGEFDKAQVALSVTTLVILLLMGILFFSTLSGVSTGAENLFIKEAPGAIKTVVAGRPSSPAMACHTAPLFVMVGTGLLCL
jgi:hypothetical protein